jgi:hypothetical protein
VTGGQSDLGVGAVPEHGEDLDVVEGTIIAGEGAEEVAPLAAGVGPALAVRNLSVRLIGSLLARRRRERGASTRRSTARLRSGYVTSSGARRWSAISTLT